MDCIEYVEIINTYLLLKWSILSIKTDISCRTERVRKLEWGNSGPPSKLFFWLESLRSAARQTLVNMIHCFHCCLLSVDKITRCDDKLENSVFNGRRGNKMWMKSLSTPVSSLCIVKSKMVSSLCFVKSKDLLIRTDVTRVTWEMELCSL